jgi:hypothetical protein
MILSEMIIADIKQKCFICQAYNGCIFLGFSNYRYLFRFEKLPAGKSQRI